MGGAPRNPAAQARGLFRLSTKFLGLGYPTVDPARQPDFFADIVGRCRPETGNLPIMEDTEIVELLLDRRGYARQFLQVVGDAARPRQCLETETLGLRGR